MKKLFGYGALLLGIYALLIGEKASSSIEKPYMTRSQREKQIQDEFDPAYTAAWRDLLKRMRIYELADFSSFICLLIGMWGAAYFEAKHVAPFMFVPCFVAMIASQNFFGARINRFQCPRCQKQPIRINPSSRSPLAILHRASYYNTKCQSCQLPVWARNAHDKNQRSYKEYSDKTHKRS